MLCILLDVRTTSHEAATRNYKNKTTWYCSNVTKMVVVLAAIFFMRTSHLASATTRQSFIYVYDSTFHQEQNKNDITIRHLTNFIKNNKTVQFFFKTPYFESNIGIYHFHCQRSSAEGVCLFSIQHCKHKYNTKYNNGGT